MTVLDVSVHARATAPSDDALASVRCFGTDWTRAYEPLDQPQMMSLLANGFSGAEGSVVVLPPGGSSGPALIVLGTGEGLTSRSLRLSGVGAAMSAGVYGSLSLDLSALRDEEQAACAAAFVEGIGLGQPRSAAGPLHLHVYVEPEVVSAAKSATAHAVLTAEAVNAARKLVDAPPSLLTPDELAESIGALAAERGWECTLLDAAAVRAAELGAIAAVGAGSDRGTWLADVTYRGRHGAGTDVCLVGKGVTMDCGGLNVKTNRRAAAYMKSDMAGAAAALATIDAVSAMGLPLNVRVLIPAVENIPGPNAIRPGDVVRHYGGRSTEVSNTDAEGRLILADCLAYARYSTPEAALIDIGTLTETGMSGSGWMAAANDDGLLRRLVAAGGSAGECVGSVPIPRDLRHVLASAVADAKNYSYEHSATDLVNSIAFLEPFAHGARWAHIDPTGAAFFETARAPWPSGATGAPARSLIALLRDWTAAS